MPWQELCALIEPFYPKAGNGRPPIGLERMLRLHFLEHWFDLSDPAAEEALYDSPSMREFVGIDLGREPVPDETTILNFRHSAGTPQPGQGAVRKGQQIPGRAWAEGRRRIPAELGPFGRICYPKLNCLLSANQGHTPSVGSGNIPA